MDDIVDSDLDARGFSLRTAYYLACASNCAYEELGDWTERLGLGRSVRVFTCGQFHGFVGSLGRIALLAFRGTENVGNCLTDAETALVARSPYPGRVHAGFAEAIQQVWPQVQGLLGSPSRTRPLWVTGHSLGGAMATLASIRLASEGFNIRAVYTYGSPRVGDRLFRDFYRAANYRLVNDNDLVPHLPFRWCYKHVGHLKLLDHEGNLTGEMAEWKCKKKALGRHAKRVHRAHRHHVPAHHQLPDFDWLADHLLTKYLDSIRTVLGRVPRRRVDSAAPTVPPPLSEHNPTTKAGISEAELIEAFLKQPHRRPTSANRL